MNKVLVIVVLLVCFSAFGFSQSKIELGLTAEGSWFMPSATTSYIQPNRNGFGAGIGISVTKGIFRRLSTDLGLIYRYKEMQQSYKIYPAIGSGYGYPSSLITEGWDKFPLHYIVIPLHLQLLLSKRFFIRGGIESTWLTNYEIVNEKPEFNWTIGFGSTKHKLSWSVNYIRGFKDQGFGNKTLAADNHYKGSIYRNNMLQLSLLYPLWQKK